MSVKEDPPGSRRYVVQFKLRRRRIHRRCPPGTRKAEAEALEVKLRRELFAIGELGVEADVPLAGAIKIWLEERVTGTKSEKSRREHARALADFVDGKLLAELADVAEAYRAHGKATGLSPLTVNRRLAILKATAKWAWKIKRWTRENLSAYVQLTDEKGAARHVYRTPAEVRRIAAKAPTFEGKAWIMLAAYSGLRQAELYGLDKTKVRRGGVLDLGVTKNGEPRLVPVGKPGLPFLKAIPFGRTRTLDSLDWEWRKARNAAGFAGTKYHDLRHTFASLLINQGVPLYVVARLLGNDPAYTAPRYAHLELKTLKRAVGKLR